MGTLEGAPVGGAGRIAVVASRFNDRVVDRLLEGALETLEELGVAAEDIDVIRVPGAWELPGACMRAATTGRYQGIVALGCVIRGETAHFDFVAGAASSGLARVALDADLPVSFGVLTTDTLEQALARAGGREENKGSEAALVVLELIDLYRSIGNGPAGA